MEEINLYLDEDKLQEVEEEIVLSPVVAGQVSKRSLFVENSINFPLNIFIELIGDDINIAKNIMGLAPKEIQEVVFEMMPSLTRIKPITARLKIKVNYVIT
jgi:hypothetical protein